MDRKSKSGPPQPVRQLYMRAKVRQLYISLFHAYARKNNIWILDHGEALQNADPLQPAQVVPS